MTPYRSNAILRALPNESAGFSAPLTPVPLPVGTELYAPYEIPKHAHFMTSGIASVVTTLSDGVPIETGMWGSEDIAEALHLGGSDRVPTRCFMQVGGYGAENALCAVRTGIQKVQTASRRHCAKHSTKLSF